MMLDIKNKARSILNLKRIVSSEVFYSAAKSSLATEFMNQPKSGKVLVLAPHPDDEIIGCGGALIKHVANGDEIKVLYLTDGSLGFASNIKPSEKEKKEMVATRELEAKKVGEKLGISDQVFLRYRDSKLSEAKSLKNYLSQTIKTFKPNIIYTPSLLDTISDHSSASSILAKALPSSSPAEIYQYEVWSPVMANVYLNIEDVIDSKCDLLKLYTSQLKSRDYVGAFRALASYRAVIFGKSKYAEAYFKSNVALFRKLSELSN